LSPRGQTGVFDAKATRLQPLPLLIAIAGGYAIGSIPVAYLITRAVTGRDIRRLGTGNVGVMNTVRHAGLPAGMMVFAGEGAKGASAYGLGRYLGGSDERVVLLSCFACLIGVNWSFLLGFSGGRGTTVGAFMCALFAWKAVILAAIVWAVLYLALRDSFVATRINICLLPATALVVVRDWTVVAVMAVVALILLYRHRRETDDRLQLAHSAATVSHFDEPHS
jgi:acyl phosphate:glycerol-3-phosphate acyltransferase